MWVQHYFHLVSEHFSREQLLEQLSSYQQLLQNVPYSTDVVLPNVTPQAMLEHVLALDRIGVLIEKDNFGEIVRLERSSAVLMTYYRNNIQHLFVLPSLVASIILHYEAIQKDLLLDAIRKIYPFLQGELFLHFNEDELNVQIHQIINEFARQSVINSNDNSYLLINQKYEFYSFGLRECGNLATLLHYCHYFTKTTCYFSS